MQITISDDLINQAINKTGLDAKTLLEKALNMILDLEQPKNTFQFPDLSEFRAKIPANSSSSANLIRAMRDEERY